MHSTCKGYRRPHQASSGSLITHPSKPHEALQRFSAAPVSNFGCTTKLIMMHLCIKYPKFTSIMWSLCKKNKAEFFLWPAIQYFNKNLVRQKKSLANPILDDWTSKAHWYFWFNKNVFYIVSDLILFSSVIRFTLDFNTEKIEGRWRSVKTRLFRIIM